jgi:hypothetical protein
MSQNGSNQQATILVDKNDTVIIRNGGDFRYGRIGKGQLVIAPATAWGEAPVTTVALHVIKEIPETFFGTLADLKAGGYISEYNPTSGAPGGGRSDDEASAAPKKKSTKKKTAKKDTADAQADTASESK